jgi:hypothetical protein
MSDPIHDLEHFTQGVDVTPLPASEVRRRGDRMRHHRNALAAVGGVAAVALIATPIALWANGSPKAMPGPSTNGPTPTQITTGATDPTTTHDIPDGFPITRGAEPDGGDFTWSGPSATAEGVVFPALCSDNGFAVSPQDRLGFNVSGPEYGDDRTLMTFDRADNAVAAMDYLRAWVSNCPSEKNIVYDILPAADYDTGYDSFTFGLSYTDGLGSAAFQATRVGRSLLMLQTYGEGSRESLPAQADQVTHLTGKITPAMCVFTETGCAGSVTMEPSDGASPSSQVLGPDGYGDLRMGMTAAEVAATGLATVHDESTNCQTMTIAGWGDTVHPNFSGQMHGYVSQTHGLAVILAQPGMRTPEGIGVGSTVSEIRAAYGELTGSAAYSTKPVNGIRYFFLTDLEKVTAFQIELADQDCFVD